MIQPTRVVINADGDAVPLARANADISIVFRRMDGWTLAAPKELELVAFALWKGDWTHFSRDLENWLPIEDFFKRQSTK